MNFVVFDTNVIVQAVYWPQSTGRRALAGLARREYRTSVTTTLLGEYIYALNQLRLRFPEINPSGAIAWIRAKSLLVEPAPVGKQRSRDPEDDPVLACALAVRAKCIVSQDRDLLDLGKPFGIAIVTPVQFLQLSESQGQV